MRISRISLVNWMPFGGVHELTNIPASPIAIVAKYESDETRSNWAGKTSLLEAVGWALHGVHRKRLDDAVITNWTAETRVTVDIADGDELVATVTRERPRGGPGRLSVFVGGGEKLGGDAAQGAIRRILGMDADDLAATVCFAQGDTEALVGMRTGDRRKLVARWLELDVWDRLLARARVYHRDASNRLAALSDVVEAVPDETALRERVAECERRVAVARECHVDATTTREAAERSAEADVVRDRMERVGVEASALREKIRSSQRSDASDKIQELREEVAELVGDEKVMRSEHTAAVRVVVDGFDGLCPVTRGKCPAEEHVVSASNLTKRRLDDASAALRAVESRRQEKARLLRDAEKEVADGETLRREYNSRVASLREIRSRLDDLESAGASPTALSVRESVAAERDASAAVVNAEVALNTAKFELASVETKRRQAEERETRRRVASADVRAAELVVKAFGSTGIPARIAAAQLHSLQERANALLAGTGLSFELAWERNTKDPTPVCYECGYTFKGRRDKSCPSCSAVRGARRSDELEILVDDGSGEIEDAKAKSGGAKVLVASAIRLAGGLMLRDVRGSRVGWALVDEPFGALDVANRATLARTFASMLGSVGLEQAFVVSHDAALLDALPCRITITRDGSSSRITTEF